MLSQFKKNSISKYKILLLITFITTLYSQEINNKYSLVLSPEISNQWWSKYNNYGQNPSEIYFNYNTNYKRENINVALKVFASKDKIYIGESFVQSKVFNNTYLKAGKYYKDFSSYLNDSLSSGSLLISNNAEPIPKVGILSSYKFKKSQKFDFNFGIAHAVLAKSKIYKTAPMLHEKFIYLNYFKDQNEFSIGFIHEAIWGGSTEEYGDFPHSYKDFLKVFISADGPLLDGEPHANALGNHLGIWDFYYKRIVNDKELKLYYQHFFEDTSGLRFDNKSDGLWGIELSNFFKQTDILFEYLNTMNQDSNPPYVNENYYNHYQYQEGWSYKGYGIGNPFINYLDNNPSKVFHVGISTNELNQYSYKLLLSRKINTSDYIKYQISLNKMINDFIVGVTINGKEDKSNNIAIKLCYNL
tara:strand:+ start:1627 stop:2871 length:1245 start_codon:yes stop_codon:yes gene_type:complete